MNNPGMDAGLILYGIYSGILTYYFAIGSHPDCTPNLQWMVQIHFKLLKLFPRFYLHIMKLGNCIVKFKLRIGINQPVSCQTNIL